jgi:very-short-patch-repair endonuclease
MRQGEQRWRGLAKNLRRRMTDAEIILWSRLRRDAVMGRRFRRQHPIGPYIADFACVAARLVVEVDGGTHGRDEEIAHDRKRDAFLNAHGWHVLRVRNDDVYKNLHDVLDGIARFIPPPRRTAGPPPQAGEENPTARSLFSSPVYGGGARGTRAEGGM